MAQLLYKLGRFAYERRRRMLAVWLVVLVAIGVGGATLGKTFTDQFSIPGTESQQAIDLLRQQLPAASGASGQVVFAAPEGERLDASAHSRAIAQSVAAASRSAGVVAVTDPLRTQAVSRDGRIGLAQVQFSGQADDIDADQREALQESFEPARAAGLKVEFGGEAGRSDETEAPIAELIGIAVAFVVLSITFGSLTAAGMPLLTAAIGVGIGMLGVTLATAFTTLSSTTTALSTMLGLAVGIDYALFIISRYRSQVFEGLEPEESAGRAVGTAGSAVVFAGATVAIALVGLAVCGIPFLTAMGLAAAGTVLVAVLIALTLVPALLGFAGRRALTGKNFERGPRAARPTMGMRWVDQVIRHRFLAVVLSIVGLGALAIPVLDMRLGLPDASTSAPDTTARKAYDLIADGFGSGFNGQLTVVAKLPASDPTAAAQAAAARLRGLDDVVSVSAPSYDESRSIAIISVTPSSSPSSTATEDLVHAIRDGVPELRAQTGAELLVTGVTATNIDVSEQLSDALPIYLLVVVGLAVVLLMIAFRSVLVPLTAIGGFLLTIGASFGAVVGVFQQGFAADLLGVSQASPIISFLPILAIGILFGLAMDYQVFLVSRMREEFTHGATPLDAVKGGFRHGARVVTAAGLIMIAVFSGFIIPDDPIIKSIGFSLAFGILIDAFVVRMTLIPALMAMLGRHAWWMPRWLDRIVPNVDIEGAALEHARPAASEQQPV